MLEWAALFAPTTPLLELFLRGTVTYLVLLMLMRIVGQRESGGVGMTDLLVVVLVADAASAGLTGDAESITDGFVLVLTLLFWSVVADAIAYRWPRVAAIIKARPRPLVVDGRLNRRAMRREFMSTEEVRSQLRLHGVEDLAEVQRAYLEPNGMISIIRRDHQEPDEPAKPPTA